jgi:hypothetical protein
VTTGVVSAGTVVVRSSPARTVGVRPASTPCSSAVSSDSGPPLTTGTSAAATAKATGTGRWTSKISIAGTAVPASTMLPPGSGPTVGPN